MDFPYLAILWNPQIPTQQQTALRLLRYNSHANWSTAMQRDGMIVFIQMPPVPYLRTIEFCGDRGILLGVLFDRARNLPQTDSSLRKDRHFLRPDAHTARHLLEDYWGGYIALWADPQSENGWVMRDPSGMLSCYYTTYRDVTLVSSTAQSFLFLTTDCMDDSTASFALDINWPYLSGFLAYSQLQVRDTGLKSVYELLAGETLVRSPSKLAVETTWNPASYSEPRPMDDLAEHGEELRDTAQSCINAWAGLHEHVVHSLSGGFDSSLILALLAHSPRRPHLICLNRYASGPAEDERHYARIAAGTANAELIEIPWNYGHDAAFDPTVDQPLDAKPSITSLMIPLEEPFFRFLRATVQFDAIWTGEGGDHLFLSHPTVPCINDFLQARGLRRGLRDIVYSTARLTGRSIPNLLLRMLLPQTHFAGDPASPRTLSNSLLLTGPHQYRALFGYIQHPWAELIRHVAPGKRQQILLLAEVLNRLRPLPGSQEAVELQPLLSQPLIELCLRIPTYEHLCDGRTRGLARRAFASDIPAEILHRELKGQTTHFALGLLSRNLRVVSALLLNGTLMSRGLLNRFQLEPLLSEREPISASQIFPLFACIAAEAWTRTWSRTLRAH